MVDVCRLNVINPGVLDDVVHVADVLVGTFGNNIDWYFKG